MSDAPSPDAKPQFRVRVTKDHLVFSAGHFVTIGDFCEPLHGHNWRVAAVVAGELDENTFVVDFIALRDELQTIVSDLDHRTLLPRHHSSIQVSEQGREVEVMFGEKRWVLPAEDCVILPIEQTTAERIAEWIGHQLSEALRNRGVRRMESLEIEVEENFGQSAFCLLTV